MLIFAGKLLLWSSFTFLYLISAITLAQPEFISYFCEDASNYTTNSTYRTNLDATLSALPTTNSGYGFFNLSTGQGNERVNAVALCRGDVTPDLCRSCLNDSIVKLRQLCPNQREAIGYYDYCLMKYSNETILGNTGIKFYVTVANPQATTDLFGLYGTLRPLIFNLKNQAAAGGSLRKFAAGKMSGPNFPTIYATVQCTPDLSERQCSGCLEDSINRIPDWLKGTFGGRIFLPMCNFRYENYQFFNESNLVIPQAPPPALQSSPPVTPPATGKNSDMTQTIIIITTVTTIGFIIIIIIASICIFIRLRKKKKKQTPTKSIETEIMDISTTESLQYNFSTIEAATNEFSKNNKLGQGGFGSVYKGKLQDGHEIAVKRLARDSVQGELEFKNEVLLVAKLQHRNLVRLLGFSLEGNERLLVYEFLPNASLDQFIFGRFLKYPFIWD